MSAHIFRLPVFDSFSVVFGLIKHVNARGSVAIHSQSRRGVQQADPCIRQHWATNFQLRYHKLVLKIDNCKNVAKQRTIVFISTLPQYALNSTTVEQLLVRTFLHGCVKFS